MKRGIVSVLPDDILRLLDYSDGGELVGIEFDPFRNMVRFCIEHHDMPEVPEDGKPILVSPTYITYTDAMGHKATLRDRSR